MPVFMKQAEAGGSWIRIQLELPSDTLALKKQNNTDATKQNLIPIEFKAK